MERRQVLEAIRTGAVLVSLPLSLLVAPGFSAAEPAPDRGIQVVHGLAADIWSSRDRQADDARRRQRLAKAIEASTNVDLLSRLVLGRHWRSMSAADRGDYRMLFSKVVIGGLAGRLDTLLHDLDGPLDQHFAVTSSRVIGKNDVFVRSKVTAADGRPLAVDWRLRAFEERLVIIDLVVEGVSLVVSQRAEFAAVIARGGIEGLIETLRRRAGSAGD
ncbi:MAG: ABC transporter substrate-binding protein [Alphaproteobacteria bacterium]